MRRSSPPQLGPIHSSAFCNHPSLSLCCGDCGEVDVDHADFVSSDVGSMSCGMWQMVCRRVVKVGERVVKDLMGTSYLSVLFPVSRGCLPWIVGFRLLQLLHVMIGTNSRVHHRCTCVTMPLWSSYVTRYNTLGAGDLCGGDQSIAHQTDQHCGSRVSPINPLRDQVMLTSFRLFPSNTTADSGASAAPIETETEDQSSTNGTEKAKTKPKAQ